jgi:metal-responsive CopG/Arc/MetJ family transcriptional regulator
MKKGVSFRIEENDIIKMDEIAKKEGINRSIVITKAIKYYINNKNKFGSNSQIKNKNIMLKIREMEDKYASILSRLNIIVRQVEDLMELKKKIEVIDNKLLQFSYKTRNK